MNRFRILSKFFIIVFVIQLAAITVSAAESVAITIPANGSNIPSDTVQFSAQCTADANKAVFLLDGEELGTSDVIDGEASIGLNESLKLGKHNLEVVFIGDFGSVYGKSSFNATKTDESVFGDGIKASDIVFSNNSASNPGGGELSAEEKDINKAWKINLGSRIYSGAGPYIDLTSYVFEEAKTTSKSVIHFTFDAMASHTGAGMLLETRCYNSTGASSYLGINDYMAFNNGKLSESEQPFEANEWYSFDYTLDTVNNILSVSVDGEEVSSGQYTQDQYDIGLALLRLRFAQYSLADLDEYPDGGYILIDNMEVTTGDAKYISRGEIQNVAILNNNASSPGGGELSLENADGKFVNNDKALKINLGSQVYAGTGPFIDLNSSNFADVLTKEKSINTFSFELFATHPGAGLLIETRCYDENGSSSWDGIKNIKAISAGKLAETSRDFKAGRWYKFEYVLDTVNNKISVYVNGEKLKEEQYTTSAYNIGLALLRLRFLQTEATSDGYILLNDISLTREIISGLETYVEYIGDTDYVKITDGIVPYNTSKLRLNADFSLDAEKIKLYENGELVKASVKSVSDKVKEISFEGGFLPGSEIKIDAEDTEINLRASNKNGEVINAILKEDGNRLYTARQLKGGETISVRFYVAGDTSDICAAITVFDGDTPVCSKFVPGVDVSVTLPNKEGNYKVETFVFKDFAAKIPISAQSWSLK